MCCLWSALAVFSWAKATFAIRQKRKTQNVSVLFMSMANVN